VQTASDVVYEDINVLYAHWDATHSKSADAAAAASGSGPTALLAKYEGMKNDIQTSIEKLRSYKDTKVDNFQPHTPPSP